jgi:hypothetical protein
MNFDTETLVRLRETREIPIDTTTSAGAARRTIIWVVADEADAYVRSVRGERGLWYRELMTQRRAALIVDGSRIPVRPVLAADDASIELVSRLLREKYGRTSRASTRSMLLPETLPTTVRLEPA